MNCFGFSCSSEKEDYGPQMEYIASKKKHMASKMKHILSKKKKEIVDNSYYARTPKKNPGRKNLKVHFDKYAAVYNYDPKSKLSVQKSERSSSQHTSEPSSASSKFPMDPLAIVRQENAKLTISKSKLESKPTPKSEAASSTNINTNTDTNTNTNRKKKRRPRYTNYIETMLYEDDDDLWAFNYDHYPFKHYNTFDRTRAAYARTNLAIRDLNDPRIYGPPQPSRKKCIVSESSALGSSLLRSSTPRSIMLASSTPASSSSASSSSASSSSASSSSASSSSASSTPGPFSSASLTQASSSSVSSFSTSSAPVMHHDPNTTVDGYYYVHNKYLFRKTLKAYRKKREREAKYEEHMQTTMGLRHSLKKNAVIAPKLDTIYEVEEPEELLPEQYVPPFYRVHDNIVDAEEVASVSSDDSLIASSLDSFEEDSIRFYGAVISLFSLFRSAFVALFGRRRD